MQQSNLNKALKILRIYHNIKQNTLAKILGITVPHLSSLERSCNPVTLQTLNKYASYFNISLASLTFLAEQLDKPYKPISFDLVSPKVCKILKWLHDTKQL